MRNKTWYEIRITTTEEALEGYPILNPMDRETVAKIKSKGLAEIVASDLRKVYRDCIVEIV